LDPEAQYTIINLDQPDRKAITGRQLMEEGLLVIAEECPSAPMIIYQLVK
jgi:hypothetical protein